MLDKRFENASRNTVREIYDGARETAKMAFSFFDFFAFFF